MLDWVGCFLVAHSCSVFTTNLRRPWLLPLLDRLMVFHCHLDNSYRCLLVWSWSDSSLFQCFILVSADLACMMSCAQCCWLPPIRFVRGFLATMVDHILEQGLVGRVCWSALWSPSSRWSTFDLSRSASRIQYGLYRTPYSRCSSNSLQAGSLAIHSREVQRAYLLFHRTRR